MSKILKIHTIPKGINIMGSVENEDSNVLIDLLNIDEFKDWLEPVSEDPYTVRCSVCNVMLVCDKNEVARHATGNGHQTAMQNSKKRKTVIGQLIGNMTNASGSSGEPRRKIILLRRSIPPNVKFEAEESEDDIRLKVLSPSAVGKVLETNQNQQRKRKAFRDEWLNIPEFKDWLSPDPENSFKARCIACDTTLNAGKSELEKHAAGAKHEKAVEALKRMVFEQHEAWDETNDIEDDDYVEDMYEAGVNVGTQTVVTGKDIASREAQEKQNEHMELLHRIALSVESMASSTASALESLNKNQETLTSILSKLINK